MVPASLLVALLTVFASCSSSSSPTTTSGPCMPKCPNSGCGGTPDGCGDVCPVSPCATGEICIAGTCEACGALDEACCTGNACPEGLSCTSGKCATCANTGSIKFSWNDAYTGTCVYTVYGSIVAPPGITCVLVGDSFTTDVFEIQHSPSSTYPAPQRNVPNATCCPDKTKGSTLVFACECGRSSSAGYIMSHKAELLAGTYDKTKIVSYQTIDGCKQ
jgi:hypothetical protein